MSPYLALLLGCSPSAPPVLPSRPVEVSIDRFMRVGTECHFVTHGRLNGRAVEPRDTVHLSVAAPALPRTDDLEGQPLETIMTQSIDGEVQVEVHNGQVLGPGGLHTVASWDDGAWTVERPLLQLPPKMKTGDQWVVQGVLRGKSISRSCRVLATPFCDQGVAMLCESDMSDRAMWNRFHYCPDLGWVGQELVVKRDDGLGFESWSTDVEIGGRPGPQVPIGRRPMPTPDDLER